MTSAPATGRDLPPRPRRSGAAAGWASPAEHAARGRALRDRVPREAHAVLPPAGRDAVALLSEQARTRVPDLVPIRHGRMLTSPFAFYRGSAVVMAADLAGTPTTGLRTQLCGDAHLGNFGVYASPERRLVFDLNDFDETAPGPFEWDVKRLAASVEVVGRVRDDRPKLRRSLVLEAVRTYRETIREFAGMRTLDVWYARLDVEDVLRHLDDELDGRRWRRAKAHVAKARARDSLQVFSKLCELVDGRPRIVADPPLVVPLHELRGVDHEQVVEELRGLLRGYRRSLTSDRRYLLEQFTLVDAARKVVGVGSVGTRAWVLLLTGRDGEDPLFLQAKEAQPSVLEPYVPGASHDHDGRRVVDGQRVMQASSDIFLGWQRVTGVDGVLRDYYVRQPRDGKLGFDVEEMHADALRAYVRMCGWTLARAHARAGDRIAIAAYLGGGGAFDRALADFAVAYADRVEADHAALAVARAERRIDAVDNL